MQKEKNIRVTSGIPRTPTSSGGIGGSGAFTYPDLGRDGYDIAGSLLFEQNAYTENKYNNDIRNITQTVEAELAKTRAANLATGKPKADATTQELNALSTLLSRKTTEHQEQIRVANLFYGYDPLSHKGVDPSEKGFDVPPRTSERDFYIAVEKWNVSFAAAYRAKLLTAQIDIINTKVANLVRAVEKQIQVAYTERLLTTPQVLESELAAVRARGATDPVAPVAAITRELSVRDSHIAAKIAEANKLDKIANAFYGSDPTAKHIDNWIALYNTGHRDPEKLLEEWTASFSAAYIAKFVRVEIDVLNTQSVKVREFLVAVQANEAEAERVASEQARVAAEAEAQRVAAAAEARRVADQQARMAAEAQAIRAANSFRIPAATGTAQLNAAVGSIAMTPGTTLTLDVAVGRAIAALKSLKDAATVETAAGFAGRLIPFAALFWTSSLGNSDLYPPNQLPTALTLPAKNLIPDLAQNLPEIAAAGGTVDAPYRVYGDHAKYSVIATQASGGVSPKVPVRALTLDPVANAYTFTTTDTPPRTLIFPIATPETSTSTTPAVPAQIPIYTGVTLTPIEVKAEALPAVDQLDIRDCIYCFPADSGLPPIYAVFSSPYEGATTKGEHSGRMYNPEKAGGPTQNLDWTTASVTQEGIDLVKLHTGRFPLSDANKIMIDRLEKILRGKISITNIDKRYYTHEIRELERYRALEVADGVEPNDDGTIWNNAHAATLEDYKLKDASDLFYTPEAIEADFKQIERENK